MVFVHRLITIGAHMMPTLTRLFWIILTIILKIFRARVVTIESVFYLHCLGVQLEKHCSKRESMLQQHLWNNMIFSMPSISTKSWPLLVKEVTTRGALGISCWPCIASIDWLCIKSVVIWSVSTHPVAWFGFHSQIASPIILKVWPLRCWMVTCTVVTLPFRSIIDDDDDDDAIKSMLCV